MSTRELPQSGLFAGEIQWLRESTTGSIETDPAYDYFADVTRDVSVTPGLNMSRRDGLGTPDAVDHDHGNETPSITVEYDLERQLVDGNGDADDPAADAILRNSDNRIPDTHHVRIREARSASDPDDPANADGCRVYTIGLGCHPNVEFESQPEDSGRVEVTLTYDATEKVREYEVFQPPGDEALDVVSTAAGDTSQTLTIEDDTGTAEDVDLNGTTAVTTTKADWNSIRALELDAEASGDVTVSLSGSGDTLATIRGAAYYSGGSQDLEGDRGVPVIGSGSLASAVNGTTEYIDGATIDRGGSTLQYDVAGWTFSCTNNYDTTPRHDSTRMRHDEGNRDVTTQFDLSGWGAAANFLDDMRGVQTDNVTIGLGLTDIQLVTAVVQEVDDVEWASDDTANAFGVTFAPSQDGGVSLSQP
jgi:hypothetical protein